MTDAHLSHVATALAARSVFLDIVETAIHAVD